MGSTSNETVCSSENDYFQTLANSTVLSNGSFECNKRLSSGSDDQESCTNGALMNSLSESEIADASGVTRTTPDEDAEEEEALVEQEETDEQRQQRELEESEQLALQLMQEEEMAAYNAQMQFLSQNSEAFTEE
jgi:hypothetical protein